MRFLIGSAILILILFALAAFWRRGRVHGSNPENPTTYGSPPRDPRALEGDYGDDRR
jgi:hypothetical protein